MASIKKYATAKGTAWRVQYRSPDGKSRTKRGFPTKAKAQAWADKNAVAIDDGQWIDPSRGATTIGELHQRWWATQQHLAASTIAALDASWRTHVEPRWGHVAVRTVHPADVQEWVDELAQRRSASIVHRAFGILRSVMADATRFRMIQQSPCVDVRLPAKRRKKLTTLTPGQVEMLAAKANRLGSLILFMGYTGVRWGEAVALQVGDVDLDRRRVQITKAAPTIGGVPILGDTKTSESRSVAIPPRLVPVLREQMRGKLPKALVWPGRDGGYLTTPSRRSWWHSAVDACMAEDDSFPAVTPHDLRHAAASWMIAQGVSVMVVQRQLGHASAKMTLDTYSHLFDSELDAISGCVAGVVKMSSN